MSLFHLRARVDGRRGTAFLPALGLLILSTALLAVLAVRPADDAATVAVVFPPWLDRSAVLSRIAGAGLPIVRDGGLASIVVVSLEGRRRESIRDRLGAWFLIDPKVAGACFRLARPPVSRDL